MVTTPSAPDPNATAATQAGLNTDSAVEQNLINMTNTVGPWGSTTYSPTGSTSYTNSQGQTVNLPQYTQTTTYSPAQQAIFDKSTQAQTNIAGIAADQSSKLEDYLNTPFTFNNGQTFNPNTTDAQNWAYDLASQRILPQQQKATDALQTQLVNQGIRPGTAAWNNAMTLNSQSNNDQLNQLALTGQQQFYNQALGTEQQQYQEAVTNRNQPINEITALLSGSQLQNPNSGTSATPQSSVAGVDYTGLVNNAYNQQVASSNAALGGLFGLAGSAATAGIKYSDARVKRDVRRVGTLDNGLPVYAYRYVWGGPVEIGVMAQDVAAFRPDAVNDVSGILAVDYARAVA